MKKARIVSRALQLRSELQIKEGRKVTLVEAASGMGVDRKALTRLEEGQTERYDGDVLARVCVYYGVGIGDLLKLIIEDDNAEAPTGL